MKKYLIIIFFVSSIALAFYGGYQFPQNKNASAVCTLRDAQIRESPTGYIITEIQTGSEIWVNEIRAPFAYVSYLHNNQWIDGTVTASYIGLCEAQ